MSVPVSTSFLAVHVNNGEEECPKLVEKQGIVSILGSDTEKFSKPSSLRRTLSADMSSKKWLAQNGFSAMKKIASSHHLAMTPINSSSSSEEGDEEEEAHDQLLAKGKRFENPPQSDIWCKIISQKAADEEASKLPPYVHPLVIKRASSLSEKSLEICTESLGSETGSDVFSSYPPSETGDADEDKEEQQQQQQQQQHEKERDSECFDSEEIQVVKYNYSTTKKSSTARSFPPPLPSLARSEGPSVHMHSHRENGRLVLEAVAIPSQNFFQAQRQNGRLLLTLVNKSPDESTPDQLEEAKVIDQSEEVFDISEEVLDQEDKINEREQDEEEDVDDEKGFIETHLYRPAPPKRASEVINVHRSALTMKKLTVTENRNPTWPNDKFNQAFNATKLDAEFIDDQKNQTPALAAHSLPPLPRVPGASPVAAAATATSFNSYEYFWRAKPTVASIINNPPTIQHSSLPTKNNSNKAYEQKDLVLLRGNKADSLVSLLRGCKEPRRSPLSWEPHCIATS